MLAVSAPSSNVFRGPIAGVYSNRLGINLNRKP